jgi:hypothetical protein
LGGALASNILRGPSLLSKIAQMLPRISKPDIDAAVQALNNLKLEKSLQSLLSGSGNGSDSREAFRQSDNNTPERCLFYILSFKS